MFDPAMLLWLILMTMLTLMEPAGSLASAFKTACRIAFSAKALLRSSES